MIFIIIWLAQQHCDSSSSLWTCFCNVVHSVVTCMSDFPTMALRCHRTASQCCLPLPQISWSWFPEKVFNKVGESDWRKGTNALSLSTNFLILISLNLKWKLFYRFFEFYSIAFKIVKQSAEHIDCCSVEWPLSWNQLQHDLSANHLTSIALQG